MPDQARAGRQAMFTAAAAVFLGGGIFLLFYSLYHQGLAMPLIASAVLFVATVISWIASALSGGDGTRNRS